MCMKFYYNHEINEVFPCLLSMTTHQHVLLTVALSCYESLSEVVTLINSNIIGASEAQLTYTILYLTVCCPLNYLPFQLKGASVRIRACVADVQFG